MVVSLGSSLEDLLAIRGGYFPPRPPLNRRRALGEACCEYRVEESSCFPHTCQLYEVKLGRGRYPRHLCGCLTAGTVLQKPQSVVRPPLEVDETSVEFNPEPPS